jgi:ribonuclease HI
MDETPEYVIHTDGGSRGNPGPGAFAYTIECPGRPAVEEKGFLGVTTNNIAEYTGLIRAMEHAKALGARRLLIQSDSELIINQMNGKYKVRHPGLLPLFEEADQLRRSFDHVTLRHVRREHNKRADRLCNEALDAAADMAPRARGPASRLNRDAPPPAAPEDPNRPDLERLVRADAWARDRDVKLQPEHLWEQIWNILVEAGVLKKKKL